MKRAACWAVYHQMLRLQEMTRRNPSLESAYQRQPRLAHRIPWRLMKGMLDLYLASGD